MKINILRAFWNFEVNELSTASRGREQILRLPRAAKTVATPLVRYIRREWAEWVQHSPKYCDSWWSTTYQQPRELAKSSWTIKD